MSFTFGFYNALNHDRLYDAVQVSEIFDGMIRDGVYSTIGDHFVVSASENDNMVVVGSGRAWFDHTWNKNDADLPITAPLPDLLLYRWDALVIDINSNVAVRTNDIIWVQGTPSLTDPQKPTLINTVEHHQYPLCYVYRKPNVDKIAADDIENTIGTDECPFVTGLLQQVNITDLLSQWIAQFNTFMNVNNAEFDTWMVSEKNAFASWMAGEKTTFDDWFENLQYVLDGDVAGHLQNEINDIRDNSGGSIFLVHTINPSLYGKKVIASGANNSSEATFDSNGDAIISGLIDIGTITITSTDGDQTAIRTIDIDYFGNYPILLAFWGAPIHIHTNSTALHGATVSIARDNVIIATTTVDSDGDADYVAPAIGTYTFSFEY